jgi:hypothetical protein
VYRRARNSEVTVTTWKSLRACAAVAVAFLLVAGLGACGTGSDDGSEAAQEVVKDLEALRKGEILIKASSSPQVYGPYVFRDGGYNLRFEHGTADDSSGRLVVALESKPRSEREPYQLVVDSTKPAGTERVTVDGKLYVHVREAGGDYVLRFTPRS